MPVAARPWAIWYSFTLRCEVWPKTPSATMSRPCCDRPSCTRRTSRPRCNGVRQAHHAAAGLRAVVAVGRRGVQAGQRNLLPTHDQRQRQAPIALVDEALESVHAVHRGPQAGVAVAGHPGATRPHVGRHPGGLAERIDAALLVVDTLAQRRPGAVDQAVVDDGDTERGAQAEPARRGQRGRPVDLVEERVLRLAHDMVVGAGPQQVVQQRVHVHAGGLLLEGGQPGLQPRAEARTGVRAVARQQLVQVARGQRGLRPAIGQAALVVGHHRDLAVVAQHAAGLEQVDDGTCRQALRGREAGRRRCRSSGGQRRGDGGNGSRPLVAQRAQAVGGGRAAQHAVAGGLEALAELIAAVARHVHGSRHGGLLVIAAGPARRCVACGRRVRHRRRRCRRPAATAARHTVAAARRCRWPRGCAWQRQHPGTGPGPRRC